MRPRVLVLLLLVLLVAVSPALAKKKSKAESEASEPEGPFRAKTFAGLELRSIGPALMSGRVSDIAVNPRNRAHYFVAVASGGVWETKNNGIVWEPLFDDEGSYSIGCVTLDPNDPLVVWVGTGENNSQRSVSYGDGVYKSTDGGKSWTNVGLKDSEHIGRIVVDPRDSNTVYVAAQGPLWNAGGDRGLYKTTDGGKSWDRVLEISDDTGVTDLVFDPRNPDVLYAAAYQRRRRTWTLINGGPESAIYRSLDAGQNWEKLERGLPKTDMGRIGLAISPADPAVIYAIVEAEEDSGGFFRSVDRGQTWDKRSDYVSGSPQYYQEIIADPQDVDRVYSLDTWMQISENGGKTFGKVGEYFKHVDNHALWIDPENTDYLLAGCDGGVYESYDRGRHWEFKANLPITQFYKVTPDNDFPFYNVYGGTQDNFTLGGPSRTTSASVLNRDWFVTLGGDGFKTQIDPDNPDLIYSQYQYGGLTRFDRASGEQIDIQPQAAPDEDPLRWNWSAALIVSPHSGTRLYYAAQRVFRSDDRGDSWTPISPDLTRGLDRNTLETMGRIQKVEAVARAMSTSQYGNVVSLSESPITEGLLYSGSDDGLIQVFEGGLWREIDSFPGVPHMSYVGDIETSTHDADRVYASFDNHKSGDFRPYLLRSDDRGKSWKSIAGDLPERGSVHTIAEDHGNPELLFAGTEFGVFFTVNGGERWIALEGGIPTIAVHDLEIQRRENDLVVGTFGRGIYILDDYTPLRGMSEATLDEEALLFPVKRAWMFVQSNPLGLPGKSMQGDGFYEAPNPPLGAVFTYYLEEELKTRKDLRQESAEERDEAGEPYRYPTLEQLRAESREEEPAVLLTVTDEEGNVVRHLTGPTTAGLHRVAWDMRFPHSEPTRLTPPAADNPFADPPRGPLATPGTYRVSLAARVDGELTPLAGPRKFETVPLGAATLGAEDREALLAFQKKTARLHRAVLGAERAAGEARDRIDHIKQALDDTPGAVPALADEVRALENLLKDLQRELSGDPVLRADRRPTPRSIAQRVNRIVGGQWSSTSAPTGTNIEAYRIAASAFEPVLAQLRDLIERDLRGLEDRLESAGAPWTPGRVPRWSAE